MDEDEREEMPSSSKRSDHEIEKDLERRILTLKFKKAPPPRRNPKSSIKEEAFESPVEDHSHPITTLCVPSISTLCQPSPVISETQESDMSSIEFKFDLDPGEDSNSCHAEPIVEVFRYDIENGQSSKTSEESEDSGFQGSPAISAFPKKESQNIIGKQNSRKDLEKDKIRMGANVSRMSKMNTTINRRDPIDDSDDEPLLPGEVDCSDLVDNPVFSCSQLLQILTAHEPEDVNAYADPLDRVKDDSLEIKCQAEPHFTQIEIQWVLSLLHKSVPSSGRLQFLPDQIERSPSPTFWTPSQATIEEETEQTTHLSPKIDIPTTNTTNSTKNTQSSGKNILKKGKRSWPFSSQPLNSSVQNPQSSQNASKEKIMKGVILNGPMRSQNTQQSNGSLELEESSEYVEIIRVKPPRRSLSNHQSSTPMWSSVNKYIESRTDSTIDYNSGIVGEKEHRLIGELVGLIGLGLIDTSRPLWFTELHKEAIECEQRLDILLRAQDETIDELERQIALIREETRVLDLSSPINSPSILPRLPIRVPSKLSHQIVTHPLKYHHISPFHKLSTSNRKVFSARSTK